GLMIGVELADGLAAHVKHLLFENKYLVGATATTIRLLPPLIITKKDADDFVKIFEKVLKEK
ncbi:MAG: aspartate aminotransferase family protein, partial [Clostridia bacterium]|nr:aspartate aminotransferase family protein [Clostridia bacterium]